MKLLISLSKKLIDSVLGYGKELLGYFETSGIAELVISKPYVRYKDAYVQMELGYMKARKNAYTDMLLTLDFERDTAYRVLRTVVEAAVFNEDSAEVAAAQLVKRLFDQYGADFLDDSYVKETAKMSKFLAELKKPENAAAIATLKLTAKLAKLQSAEDKFEQHYSLSVGDKASRDAFVSASDSRKAFEQATRLMMSYVELNLLNGDPKWEALAAQISAFNITFEQRETQRSAPKEEDKDAKA